MNRLRNRLIAVFLAATLAPLAATWWIASSLLEHSLSYSTTDQLDRLSRTLEQTGRALYQATCESLKQGAARMAPHVYQDAAGFPPTVREFFDSGETERFSLSDDGVLLYFVRRPGGVWAYSKPAPGLARLSDEYRQARETVVRARARDLRRGYLYTFVVLASAVWLVSLAALVFMAHRISRPIHQLTDGLSQLAAGDLAARVPAGGDDEIGRAVRAFNDMAAQLEHSRERLVYLTQLASWQVLARKTAHELKNSLTPIRLTVEEVVARGAARDEQFLAQAARIVIEEIEGLERRVRAFSEFAAEPPVRQGEVDVNALVQERIAFLKTGHPEVAYTTRLAAGNPPAFADEDLVKGILTNLLENAAEAAGAGGALLAATSLQEGQILIDVHDSGPGLNEEARKSLFEPTISFKKRGMGLGLSIARKNALLLGGDITLTAGELGGAGFRVTLPGLPANSYRRVRSCDEPAPLTLPSKNDAQPAGRRG